MHMHTTEHLHPIPEPGDFLLPELDGIEWMSLGDLVIVDEPGMLRSVAGIIIEVNARVQYAKVACVDGVIRPVAAEDMRLALKKDALTITIGASVSA